MTFDESVYAAVRLIPRGCVATYGQIALLCGNPRASRAVGWALRRNPAPGTEIPCHRVVNREGRLAPAFAFGGPQAQRDLLESEGVPFFADGRVDLNRCVWYGPKESGPV
ncbi:MGMT family protein [Anaerotruncus colihominis]|uniref:MGMT family protein n=1 Tax=Anaerotruncus colihominis TaxID=169435 RepID=UPI0026EA7902|nr:MGMT family protein [Anaerotruncus colihominis]